MNLFHLQRISLLSREFLKRSERYPYCISVSRFQFFCERSYSSWKDYDGTNRDRADRDRNRRRNETSSSSKSIKNQQNQSSEVPDLNAAIVEPKDMIITLQNLVNRRQYILGNEEKKSIISNFLVTVKNQQVPINDEKKIKILRLCGQINYYYNELPSNTKLIIKDLLIGIDNSYLLDNFSNYCNFFSALGLLRFAFDDFPEEKRIELLSFLSKFDIENKQFRLKPSDAENLAKAFDYLLILKLNEKIMDETSKRNFEILLNKLIIMKYGYLINPKLKKIDTNTKDNHQTAFAVLNQLHYLTKDRSIKLTDDQIPILLAGLAIEWQYMKLYDQSLAIMTLGELGLHWETIPTDLWVLFMNDLKEKLCTKQVRAVSVVQILKGWKEMKVEWSLLDEALRRVVIEKVLNVVEEAKYPSHIAYCLSAMGWIKVVWEKDLELKMKDHKIWNGFAKALNQFKNEEFSAVMAGFANMEIPWIDLPRDIQNRLLKDITKRSIDMTDHQIETLILSLAKMELMWNHLPSEANLNLINAFRTKIKDVKGMIVVLYSLGKMRFEKPQLGDENVKFLSAMLTTILKSDDLKPLEIVHVFYGLSKMGYKWNAFTRTPRIALTTLIKRRVKEFDGREISSVMRSLIEMMKNGRKTPNTYFFRILQEDIFNRFLYLKNSGDEIEGIEWLESRWQSFFIPENLKTKKPLRKNKSKEEEMMIRRNERIKKLKMNARNEKLGSDGHSKYHLKVQNRIIRSNKIREQRKNRSYKNFKDEEEEDDDDDYDYDYDDDESSR